MRVTNPTTLGPDDMTSRRYRTSYQRIVHVHSQREANSVASDGKTIALIGTSPEMFKFAVFRCPDGCGEMLRVNLMRSQGRAWRATISGGTLTLSPSVARESGCRTHFVLVRNVAIRAFFSQEAVT